MKVNKRLVFTPVTQQILVSGEYPYVGRVSEAPDLAATVTISNLERVYTAPSSSNQFFINRSGDVYFHESKKNSLFTINYFGGGSRILAEDFNNLEVSVIEAKNLVVGLTSLVFGNIRLVVTPSSITTSKTTLNTKVSSAHKVNFSLSLKNNNNAVYSWINGIPLYVDVSASFVDNDIDPPTLDKASGSYTFEAGICTVVATFDTDVGQYKKYSLGDSATFSFSTISSGGSGLELSKIVTNSITN